MDTRKVSGQVYTPQNIVTDILDLAKYKGGKILGKHIMDNSCGDGAFLTEIVKRYCETSIAENRNLDTLAKDLKTYIHGIDIDKDAILLCKTRLDKICLSYGIGGIGWDIHCEDALDVIRYNGKMDYVIGNPPYVRVHNMGDIYNKIHNFVFAQDGMKDLYIVFFEIGINMLNDNGFLAYITPSSYFTSVAGKNLRNYIYTNNLLNTVVDLGLVQPFTDASAYTAITLLEMGRQGSHVLYYANKEPIANLRRDEYCINNRFFFGTSEEVSLIRRIQNTWGTSDIEVNVGYQTSCDKVFIHDFDFESEYIIPVIKSSTGETKKIFYPYDKKGNIIPIKELFKDYNIFSYLSANRDKLENRDYIGEWYCYGRTQAIKDTYKDKLAINWILRDENDLKIERADAGVGVYGGIYIYSDTIDYDRIEKVLRDKEFTQYVKLLKKYKRGGYYAFSAKDLKIYLDYKLSNFS